MGVPDCHFLKCQKLNSERRHLCPSHPNQSLSLRPLDFFEAPVPKALQGACPVGRRCGPKQSGVSGSFADRSLGVFKPTWRLINALQIKQCTPGCRHTGGLLFGIGALVAVIGPCALASHKPSSAQAYRDKHVAFSLKQPPLHCRAVVPRIL